MTMQLKTLSFLFIFCNLYAQKLDNLTASYNGNTGILETPNARILDDWSMRFFLNIDKPYKYYGATVSPLPFMEANFHMTEVSGIDASFDSDGYGNYKDKSLGIKLLLKEETKYTPSVLFGIDDIWGTALYTSKYIAMSKKIGYFDFTLGYAKGRLGGEDLRKYTANTNNSGSFNNNAITFLKDRDWGGGKPFGSIVFNLSPKLSLVGEYSSINYSKDKKNPFLNGKQYELPKSKFNYGLKYKYSDNSIFSLSYQRGNQISFGYNYQFNFDRTGMFDHSPDPKWKADENKKNEYKNLSSKQLSEKLSNEVAAEKFKNVKIAVNDNKIWSEINNSRYNNDLQAVGRAISTIDEVAPEKFNTIYLTLKDKELPLKTFKVNRSEFDMYENEKVSDKYMQKALIITNSVEKSYDDFLGKKDVFKTKSHNSENFKYAFTPKARTILNHKDKPFALKLSLRASASYYFNKYFSISAAIEHPFYNSGKDLTNEPLENEKLSLRSNVTEHFIYNETQMPYLSTSFRTRLPYDSFFKAELGYLEYAFAGLDLEWYKPFMDERFGLGFQYQSVYKRKIDGMIYLNKDYKYDTKFMNIYTLISPKYDIHMGLKLGQFLAGDKGGRIDLIRHYKNFTIGAYATYTNSKKIFDNSENQGYIDKGVYIVVPLEVFTYKNIKKRVKYGLSPWTRDVGQYAGTLNALYPMNNSENNTQIQKKHIQYLKK